MRPPAPRSPGSPARSAPAARSRFRARRAVARSGRRHRARLVAGAWLYHAAARRPARRHPAAVARRAPTPRPCWMRCCARPSAGRRERDQRIVASSTARPLVPTTFTLSLPHLNPRAMLVGGLAGEFVGVRVGLHVDIGDMADRTRRQPRHRQHRFCDRPAVLVLVGIVGDVPALDDGEGFAVQRPPFHGVGGRIERAEPRLRRRLPVGARRGCGRPRRFRASHPR